MTTALNLRRGYSGVRRSSLILFVALAVLPFAGLSDVHASVHNVVNSEEPLRIRQGPIGVAEANPSDPFWFQQGAIGDQSTYNSVGASVMIRTVYDKVNNDAHSYWVGSILSNGAFVQVGYYNGLTTTNQYYCCAWFYEFFPPNNSCLPNPYGVAEIERVQTVPNDFLAGSDIVSPWPDECGNPSTSVLWSPALALTCTGANMSFSFLDRDGKSITPAWISLSDSTGAEIFYTDQQYYQSLTVPNRSGQWTVNQISWHSTNVAIGSVVNSTATSQIVPTNVFSVQLLVVGYFYSLPLKDTTVIMYLPDSTNETVKTDNNGQAVFTQLPAAIYTYHVTVPYGIPATTTQTISNGGSPTAAHAPLTRSR